MCYILVASSVGSYWPQQKLKFTGVALLYATTRATGLCVHPLLIMVVRNYFRLKFCSNDIVSRKKLQDKFVQWNVTLFMKTQNIYFHSRNILLNTGPHNLTHYQRTNFRLFQNERVCRRQFQI